jgi:hypothetical protein
VVATKRRARRVLRGDQCKQRVPTRVFTSPASTSLPRRYV